MPNLKPDTQENKKTIASIDSSLSTYIGKSKKSALNTIIYTGETLKNIAYVLGWSVQTVSFLAMCVRNIAKKADAHIEMTNFLAKSTQYELLNSIKKMGRAHSIRTLLIVSMALGVFKNTDTVKNSIHNMWNKIEHMLQGDDIPEKQISLETIQNIDLHELKGYGQTKLDNNFLSIFLTGERTTPNFTDTVTVNFRENLRKAYDIKFANNPKAKERAIQRFYDETVKKYIDGSVNFHAYSLEQRAHEFDETVSDIQKHFDWSFLAEPSSYNLSGEKISLIQNISQTLSGKDAISFSLTEICGDLPGKFGVKYMETLCQYGGREYVMMLPALADDLVSMGPYQNTSYVVHEGIGAASKMSEHGLPFDMKIPGSMIFTHPAGKDKNVQHKVAYLNMVYNLVYLMLHLSDDEYHVLEKKWSSHHDEIVQYIATAHNRPANAVRAMKNWLKKNGTHTYIACVDNKILPYAKRTKKFQEALKFFTKEMNLTQSSSM